MREALINFSKVYYPQTYKDFNETSPGMMFIEMGAYVGDVLSYYIDKQFKESLFVYATERETVMDFSYVLGYKPKPIVPASVTVDVFQLIPSNAVAGAGNAPDWSYAVNVKGGMVITSNTNSNVFFRTIEDCDFRRTGSFSTGVDDGSITVHSLNAGVPDYYLLRKRVRASAGTLKTETFSFSEPKKFEKILLTSDEVTSIISATDSDGYTWYEVPFLAQDTILESVPNTAVYDPTLNTYFQDTPYLLKLKKVPRRFEVRVRSDNRTELRFGSGISTSPDEEIVPNVELLSSTLPDGNIDFEQNIDPTNFLFTRTYGQIPHNTTLTVTYLYGGGVESNVQENDLTKIDEMVVDLSNSGLDTDVVNQVKNSIAVSNSGPATGGKNSETTDEIKLNAMAQYASQNRAVTRDDYLARILSMPPKFGSVAKTFIIQDTQLDAKSLTRIDNQLALNAYVLGYTNDGKLTTMNPAVKENLKVYLSQYRLLTDAINIQDAFIVNIGVTFRIVVLPKYNKNEVLLRSIDAVKAFFAVEKWQINQPIILYDIINEIASVEGVQSVIGKPTIENRWLTSQGYSGNYYAIEQAISDDVVYPPLDPSIFEVKYPDTDIKGQVVTYTGS